MKLAGISRAEGGGHLRWTSARLPAVQVIVLIAATSGMLAWTGWWHRATHDAAPLPAILYEQLAGGQVQKVSGTVSWTVADDSAEGPGVVAHLAVPDRGLTVRMSFRKNTDPSLPASHLVEIVTQAAPSFIGKEIRNVPALMVPTLGAPKSLTGLSSKIADGAFWIALSDVPRDTAANFALLRYSHLIDLPLVYASGQRAALEFPKGAPGERLFRAAMVESARLPAAGGPVR